MTPRLAGTPVLETARMVLRVPGAQDYPAWRAFYTSPRAVFIGAGPQMDEGRAWRAFASVIGHWALRGCGVFALTLRGSDTAIGTCGPWCPAGWPEREISWSLWSAEHEGKGLMTEAARAVLPFVHGVLGWDSAVSYIDRANAPSIALAERLGAVRDPAAPAPRGDPGTLVYRHPVPDDAGGMEAYA